MTPEVQALRKSLIDNIHAIADQVQLKLGDKAILERELRHLCTGKRPAAVKEELKAREIVLC